MFFPKERSEAEVIARNYALDHIRKNKIPVPDKNAPPNDPTRKIYDSVFKDSYNEEFQRRFIPVDLFFTSIRNFYITAVAELQKRFAFDDDVFNVLQIVKPKNARRLSTQSLSSLFKRFPVLSMTVNEDDAETEWRDQANLSEDIFDLTSNSDFMDLDPEFYWQRVFKMKTPSGNSRFPNLKVCISLLLSLPFSNASAERCFSIMKDTKPPKKNRLHDRTVDGIIKGKTWLNNQSKSASQVDIPDALMKLTKKVKANAVVLSSESDSE